MSIRPLAYTREQIQALTTVPRQVLDRWCRPGGKLIKGQDWFLQAWRRGWMKRQHRIYTESALLKLMGML